MLLFFTKQVSATHAQQTYLQTECDSEAALSVSLSESAHGWWHHQLRSLWSHLKVVLLWPWAPLPAPPSLFLPRSFSPSSSSSSSLCNLSHCWWKKGAHLWSVSAHIGGRWHLEWPVSSCSVILNGKHVTLCQIVMQRIMFSAFKKWHYKFQNVRKAEVKVLETWEEV